MTESLNGRPFSKSLSIFEKIIKLHSEFLSDRFLLLISRCLIKIVMFGFSMMTNPLNTEASTLIPVC